MTYLKANIVICNDDYSSFLRVIHVFKSFASLQQWMVAQQIRMIPTVQRVMSRNITSEIRQMNVYILYQHSESFTDVKSLRKKKEMETCVIMMCH